MNKLMVREASLEEQVLRALFEAPASARECATGLRPYDRPSQEWVREIIDLLRGLAEHAFVSLHVDAFETRYSLTPAGSERLADLVEVE